MRVPKIIVHVLCLTMVLVPFQNCSPYHAINGTTDLSSAGTDYTDAELAAKFDLTLKPFLKQNCAVCHGSFQDPKFAVDDSLEAVRTIKAHNLVNFNDPASSRFVKKIEGGHNDFPLSWASELQGHVAAWDQALKGSVPVEPGDEDTEFPSVMINSPIDGATISALVNLQAIATDNVAVAGVSFYMGSTVVGVEDLSPPYEASLNPADFANGSYELKALARDTSGNTQFSATLNIIISYSNNDVTPPAVSITAPANASQASGAITITGSASDNVGVAGVQLLVDGVMSGSEDTSAPYSFSLNTMTLANGSRALSLRARDAAGNMTTSAVRTINVNNAAPDTTAPAVSITAPAADSSVSGSVVVTGNATDNVAVVGVQLLVDGTPYGNEDLAAPYSISLNTNSLTNGSHSLTLRARDAANNMTTSQARAIMVNNVAPDTTPPTVSISSPANGSTQIGTITITANASDNVAVAGVYLVIDGSNVGTEDTTSPYQFIIDTKTLTNASHTIAARARDTSNGMTLSASRSITVNNVVPDTTAPTVSIGTPSASGTTVSGVITIAATASDAVGVAGVQFFMNGAAIGAEDTSAPYSTTFNTTTLTNATHTITARARDAANNMATSSNRTIVVNNQQANPNATFTWIFANVLQPKCVACHGTGLALSGVRYNSYAETIKTLRTGNASSSKLYTETNSGSMPDGGSKLSTTELNAIRDWINAGALNN